MADVRRARVEELPLCAETLASAFNHDPVFMWMTPERGRLDRLRRFYFKQLQLTVHHGGVFTSEDNSGVAIWLPPDNWKTPNSSLLRAMPTLMRSFGARLPRVLAGLTTIENKHPKDPPHWYLEFLGTRRDVQRKGVGTSVISAMLDRCDQDAIPAYLEASSPENVPFYLRHGFQVIEEIQLRNGPPVWGMWREPR